jgi:hypothetical protein
MPRSPPSRPHRARSTVELEAMHAAAPADEGVRQALLDELAPSLEGGQISVIGNVFGHHVPR